MNTIAGAGVSGRRDWEAPSQGPTPKREPMIAMALNDLENAAASLREATVELRVNLTPVLGPEQPQKPVPEQGTAAMTPLQARIGQIRDIIGQSFGVVRDIRDRLEV